MRPDKIYQKSYSHNPGMNSTMSLQVLRPARAAATRNLRLARMYHPATSVFAANQKSSVVNPSSPVLGSKLLFTLTTTRRTSILGSLRLYSTSPPNLPHTPLNEVSFSDSRSCNSLTEINSFLRSPRRRTCPSRNYENRPGLFLMP